MIARSTALLVAPLATSTCYRVEETGSTTTLAFATELVLGLGVGAAVAFALGIAFLPRARTRRAGLAITVVAALAGALVVPGMSIDRVVVTPTEVRQHTGFWFAPTNQGFRYADVDSVSIREVQSRRQTDRIWFLDLIGGGQEQIDPGDLWENHEELIVAKLRAFGVDVR